MQAAKLIPAVIVLKAASTAKADLETMVRQVAQVTTRCVPRGILIEDVVVTFGNAKDVEKRVKSLVSHKDIKLLLLYSAKQVADTEMDFNAFVDTMREWHGIKVICFR